MYDQELISTTKWHKGALKLCGLLILTVVKRCYVLLPFKDSANN